MSTILKRGDKYQAQVCIAGQRFAKTFAKLSDARRWALAREAEAEEGFARNSRAPLSDAIERYRREVASYQAHCRHALAVFGYLLSDPIAQLPTYAVTSEDILGWMERRRTVPSRATGKIVTEATIRRQLEMISGFFSWAVEQKLIKDNPCRGVKKPAESDARERIASDDEIERLKIAAGWEEGMIPRTKTQRVCAAFVLACLTGMRSGEMMRIERSWIRGNVLWIPMEATKTEHFRKIALSDRARKILDDVVSLGIEPSIWGLSDGSRDSLWRKIRERCDVSRREQALGGGGPGDQACGTLDDVLLHAVCQWKRRHRFSPISGNWHATRLRISFFILTGISRTPPFLLQVDDQIQPLELKSPQRSTRFFDHQANT